jgi:hypothetical protein
MGNEALTTRGPMGLERPSFIKAGDTRGTENIGSNDIRPPALRIAQSNSPEAKRTEKDKYIQGLTEGMFFNSTTREIYGEGPIQIVIVNQLGHRNVEFDPNDKKVVLDFNVPDGDPRTNFTTEVKDGKQVRLKPRATTFYDYLILVVTDGRRDLMTMSLKSTQLKKAKDLNTLLAGAKMPAFSFLFDVSLAPEHGKGNSWYGWKFTPAGYVTEELYNECDKLYGKMSGKTIQVDAEGEEGDGASDDKVPF